MSLESGSGSGGGSLGADKKKKGGGRGPVVLAPGGPNPASAPSTLPGTGGGTQKKAAGGGGLSGAEARANAREDAAKRKAGNRYLEQARNLDAQAKALMYALRKSYGSNLRQQLSDINDVLKDQNALVREGYRARYGSLRGSAEDNDKALADASQSNLGNMVRERTMALGEAMAQGAGESDLLRAALMSARNWQANQSDVQRGYSDTLRSINSALTDLTIDTKSGLANNHLQANSDREQLWANYYDQRGESFTQLGNIRGQQADYYAMAKEMGVERRAEERKALEKAPVQTNEYRKGGGTGGGSKKIRKQAQAMSPTVLGKMPKSQAEATRQSHQAFMAASKEAAKSWDNPGVPDRLMRWQGRDPFEAQPASSTLNSVPQIQAPKAPEGATLRKW